MTAVWTIDGEQVDLPRQGRAAAAPGDLGHGAAEVEVDVVRAVLLHEHPDGLADGHGVHAVQLDGADFLVVVVRNDAQRFRRALDEGTRGDHLRHVQAAAVFTAQPAERGVGDARHGSQDHGGVHRDRAQLQGREFQLGGGRGCYNSHPSIVSKPGKSARQRNHPGQQAALRTSSPASAAATAEAHRRHRWPPVLRRGSTDPGTARRAQR